MKIILDFPDMELSPNRKNGKHWTSTKNAKHSRYQKAFILAKEALNNQYLILARNYQLNITFIEPDKRRRDIDNMLASLKQDLDAISKAIGVDDRYFDVIVLKRGYQKGNGQTIIEITP